MYPWNSALRRGGVVRCGDGTFSFGAAPVAKVCNNARTIVKVARPAKARVAYFGQWSGAPKTSTSASILSRTAIRVADALI